MLPIALAGEQIFSSQAVNADTYILTLPLFFQQQWLSIFVYIGGLAAATSMVIVAVIVLSTMFTTQILGPGLLRLKPALFRKDRQFSKKLLMARRISIAGLMLLALLFERMLSQQSHLSSIGILSFVLLAQFSTPPLQTLPSKHWVAATTVIAISFLMKP